MDQDNRVVVLIDMDCFYCQVEEKLNPELKGQPIAVVQYNPWKGGGIIAVNYVARARGVTRHMRGDEAREKCPDIQLPSVPSNRGKANITKYRDAGIEVAKVLQTFTPLLERASIDEAYLDITAPVNERLRTLSLDAAASLPATFALGYDSMGDFVRDVLEYGGDCIDFDLEHARRLLAGAALVHEIRAAVLRETGYTCSAGIAHNKILAKLVCGMNKPNKQTILPKHTVNILYKTLPVKKVKHLGGKFGLTVCEVLKISNMIELQKFTEKELQARFDEKNGTWLYNIARGIDLEPVQAKFNPKSIGCCKNFKGKSALLDLDSLTKWLKELGDEIEDRLEKDAVDNNRAPKQMVASFSTQLADGRGSSSSRSYNFVSEEELCAEFFSMKALELVMDGIEGVKVKVEEPNRKLKSAITFLGISVGKFEDHTEHKKSRNIMDFFAAGSSKDVTAACKNKDVKVTQSDGPKTLHKDKRNENMMRKFFKIADTGQSTMGLYNNEQKSKESIKVQSSENELESISSKSSNITQPNETRRTKDNKENDKEYIMRKFFNIIDNDESVIKDAGEKNKLSKIDSVNQTDTEKSHVTGLQSPLDKQESFFAKLLQKSEVERPSTPLCKVVACGEDSDETNCSGSTIDMEINKSIALFEDDPETTTRVSSMRDLLNKTMVDVEAPDEPESTAPSPEVALASPQREETFECPECMKTIPIDMFDTHTDYHFALNLRNEERQQKRNEIKQKTNEKTSSKEETTRKKPPEQNKNETVSSIASFFVKVDSNAPMEKCAECGKRVPVEKFTEHLDFHEAQKLSRELNKKPIPYPTPAPSSAKRKRSTLSPVKKQKLPCKSIQSFFGSNR